MILERLCLSRSTLDRAAHRRGDPGLVDRALADPATRVLLLDGELAPVLDGPAGPRLALRPPRAVAVSTGRPVTRLFLGEDGAGRAHVGLAVASAPRPDPYQAPEHDESVSVGHHSRAGAVPRWAGLREVGQLLDDTDAGLLTTAVALANWHAVHPRCARCGQITNIVAAGWSRHCPACAADHFPRTDPAVIMSVVDDGARVLLGRQVRWPEGRFSTLAGFVEPGESLEAAVRREVMEEAGIAVDRVEYLGNQPWPFPSSLMLAFRAHATSTMIRVDGEELAQARWWSRDELAADVASRRVLLPPPVSIARRLVEDWFGAEITDAAEAWR